VNALLVTVVLGSSVRFKREIGQLTRLSYARQGLARTQTCAHILTYTAHTDTHTSPFNHKQSYLNRVRYKDAGCKVSSDATANKDDSHADGTNQSLHLSHDPQLEDDRHHHVQQAETHNSNCSTIQSKSLPIVSFLSLCVYLSVYMSRT
jgi:hypothetical protein